MKIDVETRVASYATFLSSLKGVDKGVGDSASALGFQFLHSNQSLDSSSRSQSESGYQV